MTVCVCCISGTGRLRLWGPRPRSNINPYTYKSCRWTRSFSRGTREIPRLPARVSNRGSAAGHAQRGRHRGIQSLDNRACGAIGRGQHLAGRALKLGKPGQLRATARRSACSVQAYSNSPRGINFHRWEFCFRLDGDPDGINGEQFPGRPIRNGLP